MTPLLRGVLLFATLLALSGCGDDPASGDGDAVVTPQPNSCIGVPAAKCDELVADASSQFGVARIRGVHIACSRVPCTMRSGETTVDVELTDGRHVSFTSAWHTAGDPEPAPSLGFEPTCSGVDRDHCIAQVAQAVNSTSEEVVGVDVRCVGTCTSDHGQGETVITFTRGKARTISWAYGPSG